MRAMAGSEVLSRRRRRLGPGWVPNQHGAWAMLASPLLVGILAGGFRWVHLLLAAFWFTGYFAFFATSQWLKSRRRARYLPAVRTYAAATALLGIALLAVEPRLWRWAPAFVVPLAVGLWFASRRNERALISGLITSAAGALMTMVAYDAGPAADPLGAWPVALVQLLYFAGTVFYVKTVIRERDNPTYLRLSVGYHLAAIVVASALSWWLTPVFLLLALRAAVVPGRHPLPKQVGIGEIVATVVVAMVSLLVL